MNIYIPNYKKVFLLVFAVLLLLLLLLISIRPSQWNKETLVETQVEIEPLVDSLFTRDSLVIIPDIIPDTQLVIQTNWEDNSIDTAVVITEIVNYDTLVLKVVVPTIVEVPTVKNVPQLAAEQEIDILKTLVYVLLFLVLLIAFAIYMAVLLMKRMDKSYWTKHNVYDSNNTKISFSSSEEIPFSPLRDALVQEAGKPILIVKEDPVFIAEQVVEKEEEVEEKGIVEEEKPEKKRWNFLELIKKILSYFSALTKEITSAVKNPDQTEPKEKKVSKPISIKKILLGPILIIARATKTTAFFSQFIGVSAFEEEELDNTWQDYVSFILIITSIICLVLFLPGKDTDVYYYIVSFCILWLLPSFIRINKTTGIIGIVAISIELLVISIKVILDNLTDGPADTRFFIAGAILLVLFLLYKFKHKITWSSNTRKESRKGVKESFFYPFVIINRLFEKTTSIAKYLSSNEPEQAFRQEINEEQNAVNTWHDYVSILLIVTTVITTLVFYPRGLIASRFLFALLIALFVLILMAIPSFIRDNAKRGISGITTILAELIAVAIKKAITALANAPASETNITEQLWTYLAIAAAVLVVIYILNKFKEQLFSHVNKSFIFFVLILITAFLLFRDYFLNDFAVVYQLNNGLEGVVGRLIILLIIAFISLLILRPKEPEKLKAIKALLTNEKAFALLSQEKEWWKKVSLNLLEDIRVSNAELDEFGEFVQVYLPKCTEVRKLDLSYNQFAKVSSEIIGRQKLNSLDLSYNNISQVSSNIQTLTKLTNLNLSSNRLARIPKELGALKELELLNLAGNPLQLAVLAELEALLPNCLILYDASLLEEINQKIGKKQLLTKVEIYLEEELENPDSVTFITLNNHDLSFLPVLVMQKFNNLRLLNLSNNQFAKIPDVLYTLPSLTSLDMANNQLAELSDRIAWLSNLEMLNLSDNKNISISDSILALRKLKCLKLSGIELKEIPSSIFKIKSLSSLHLDRNNLSSLSDEILLLSNLEELDLSYNNLTVLPKGIEILNNLKILNISGNPFSLDYLDQLKVLLPDTSIINSKSLYSELLKEKGSIKDLQQNNKVDIITNKRPKKDEKELIKEFEQLLEKELENPGKVSHIHLSDKKLTDLPLSVLQKFKKLKYIDLSNNLFTEIPEALYHLSSLREIDLSYNKIMIVSYRLEELSSLEKLILNRNSIQFIWPNITKLKKFRRLDLNYNNLKKFPAFIFKLKELEILNLSNNKFSQFPKGLQVLPKLKQLSLSNMGLEKFPAFLSDLKELETLDLSNNKFEEKEILRIKQEFPQKNITF